RILSFPLNCRVSAAFGRSLRAAGEAIQARRRRLDCLAALAMTRLHVCNSYKDMFICSTNSAEARHGDDSRGIARGSGADTAAAPRALRPCRADGQRADDHPRAEPAARLA